MAESLAGLSVPFIVNRGQTDAAVAYYAPTQAGTVFVTRDGRIVYSLPGKGAGPKLEERLQSETIAGWSLTEVPVGTAGRARPVGEKRAQTQVAYFLGNDPSAWMADAATYEEVSLGQVWPGVTLSLRARGKSVEKVFTVEPNGDPSRIGMRISGAQSLKADGAGDLVVSTGPGDVTLTRPVAYQERAGARRAVTVAYAVHGDTYTFRLGGYDPRLPLTIDPLLQATYLGGSGSEFSQALAIHPTSGDVYVAGTTTSSNFPGTTGGAQPVFKGGSYDAFIARLSPDLRMLKQATYLGGNDTDLAYALAIDAASGDVYAGGVTLSTNFPGTAGGAQPAIGGSSDVFVAHLSADLKTLIQATYLGGSGHEIAFGLAIRSGSVYVTGWTDSFNFPGTAGGFQTTFAGGFFDAFVARFTTDLKALTQATYLGTAGDDQAYALTIDPTSGSVYVAGYTSSTIFNGGSSDAFVALLSADLTTLTRATLVGGNGDERAYGLAVHPTSGDIYVSGYTSSTNLPGASGGAQPTLGGSTDGFVARLSADLSALIGATYLGGSGNDFAQSLAIHPTSGDIYVSGYTASANFPGTAGGAQAAYGGGSMDAFVAHLTADLATLSQATYLGGGGDEQAGALAIHPVSGNVYAAGFTSSANFPGTTGGAQATNHGSNDAFVALLTPNLASARGPLSFYTLAPCRVIDTRQPVGPYGGPSLVAGASRDFVITGQCGIPLTAVAVSVNVVVINPTTGPGFLTLYPGGVRPINSTINYNAGKIRANNAIEPLGSSGDVTVFCGQGGGTADLVIDTNGYFQ